MNKMMKQYLKRAEQIIGKRTAEEIAHDNEVILHLKNGLPIKRALTIAGDHHPDEAIAWDKDNIHFIAEHYDFLKEHNQIVQTLNQHKPNH